MNPNGPTLQSTPFLAQEGSGAAPHICCRARQHQPQTNPTSRRGHLEVPQDTFLLLGENLLILGKKGQF